MSNSQEIACALVFLYRGSAENSCVRLPDEANWSEITALPKEQWPGAFAAACRACEERWPVHLIGFFEHADFERESHHALARAVRTVEKYCQRAEQDEIYRHTILGDVYQELRGLSSKQAQGAFFTPWHVASMMASIAGAAENPTAFVIDPACGAGVMLLAALDLVRQTHGPIAGFGLTLIGVDINPRVCEIARASLLLAGADPDQFWIFRGNALAQPIVGRYHETGELHTLDFHVTLANPPFGSKVSHSDLERDAADGPLEIPAHVLYREIPVLRTQDAEIKTLPEPEPAVAAKPRRSRKKAA